MVKQKMQNGYIECLDKPYIFTYDGELLQLVPKDKELIRPYDFLKNKEQHFEILEGINQRCKITIALLEKDIFPSRFLSSSTVYPLIYSILIYGLPSIRPAS